MELILKNALQYQLEQSLLFAPCLGINVTLKDEKYGVWTGASGFSAASPFFRMPCYGLGVMLDPESACGEKIGHGGDGPGYNTWVMYLPSFKGRKLTIAVFCNTSMAAHPFSLINDLLYVLGDA